MHPRVYDSAIYNSQDMEATQCSSTDEWIKKTHCIYYSEIKKNKRLQFATTRMNPEIIILSEVSQTQKDKYHLYVESKKYDTDELIFKTISQTQKTNLWLPKGKGINQEFGMNRNTLLYITQKNNQDLLIAEGMIFNILE